MVSERVSIRQVTGAKYCSEEGCRQTRGYIEDGRLVCRAGHVDPDWQEAQDGEDNFFSQGRQSKLKDEAEVNTRTTLSGKQALDLYRRCYQHLLRLQCRFLIQTKGFPPELERVLKEDLWAVRMSAIEKDVGSKLQSDEDETDAESSVPLYSSQSEGEGEPETKTYRELRRVLPSVIDSLGLIYVALMMLSRPVSMQDLQRWATQEEMPFLRPLRYIPGELTSALPIKYRTLLETTEVLQEGDLHDSVRNLLYLHYNASGLVLQPLQYQSLLFEHIKALALPILVYETVQDFARTTPFDFSFPAVRESFHSFLPEIILLALVVVATKHLYPFSHQESYAARSTADPSYLQLSWPDWVKAHQEIVPPKPDERLFTPGSEARTTDDEVMNLSKTEMDQWMDWYAQTWLDPDSQVTVHRRKKSDLPERILDMFPIDYGASRADGRSQEAELSNHRDAVLQEAAERRLSVVMMATKTLQVVPKETDRERTSRDRGSKPLRVGQKYPFIRQAEELHGPARVLHELVAARATISVERLIKAVLFVEWKIDAARRKRVTTTREHGSEEMEDMEDIEIEDEMEDEMSL